MSREAPRHVGVDDLVDHDPRRRDAQPERELHRDGDARRARRATPRSGSVRDSATRPVRRHRWRAPSGETSPTRLELRREQLRVDADLGRRLCDLAAAPSPRRHCRRPPPRARRRTARRRGERRARARRSARAAAPIAPRRRRVGEPLERGDDRRDLRVAADGHLERDVVGKLGEPADVADDERLAERERADRAARRLAHRRRTQQHARVARGEQRPEPRLLDVRLADHAFASSPSRSSRPSRSKPGRLRADEQQARAGMRRAELGERTQQLRDALVLVQVPEAADERRAVDRDRLDRGRRPRRMRDAPERPVVAVLARVRLGVARVDDHAGRAVEHLARERELLRAAPPRAAARGPRARPSRACVRRRPPRAPSR